MGLKNMGRIRSCDKHEDDRTYARDNARHWDGSRTRAFLSRLGFHGSISLIVPRMNIATAAPLHSPRPRG